MVRYEFLDESINELNVHPNNVFEKELSYAKKLIENGDFSKVVTQCPACNGEETEVFFSKWGQEYSLCTRSWSLYLNRLPEDDFYNHYFKSSELAVYRASDEYQDQVAKSRANVWSNYLDWVDGRIKRYIGMDSYNVVEWGGKFKGLSDQIEKLSCVQEFGCVDTLPPVKEREIDNTDVIVMNNVVERTLDIEALLKSANDMLNKNGLLIITTKSAVGFDVLTLKGESDIVFPLDHINLFSPKGITDLLNQSNFQVLELTTPGLLDVKYTKNRIDQIHKEHYFQRYLMDTSDEYMLERIQSFLQRNNLSSYLCIVARKVEER